MSDLETVEHYKKLFSYPWKSEYGSFPDEKTKAIHDLLDIIEYQGRILSNGCFYSDTIDFMERAAREITKDIK